MLLYKPRRLYWNVAVEQMPEKSVSDEKTEQEPRNR